MQKKYIVFGILLIPFLVFVFLYAKSQNEKIPKIINAIQAPVFTPTITLTPTPTPFIFTTYNPPKIEQKQVYKIAMIGDSMTAALGPHGGEMSEYMNTLYKKNASDPQRILIDNYAKSSNILAVNDQLFLKTSISEYTFGPLLSDDYDLILVESYAYNPLSQFGIAQGIYHQNLELTKLMETLITKKPSMAIVFVSTIAPNMQNYAKTTQKNNSITERRAQAQERIDYLKNHIEYAKNHNIPIVNIYEKSLTVNGDGNMVYINPTDDIHPSFTGVTFIAHAIGDFILNSQILPRD